MSKRDSVTLPSRGYAGTFFGILSTRSSLSKYCSCGTRRIAGRPCRSTISNGSSRRSPAKKFTGGMAMADTDNIRRLADRQAADGAWLDDCVKGENGKPLPVLANVLAGLRALFEDTFAFDEMLRVPVLLRELAPEPNFTPRPCTDVDVGVVQEKLQHLGLKRISKDVVHQAVDMRAHECRFQPVRNYLYRLHWDDQPRLASLFPLYF